MIAAIADLAGVDSILTDNESDFVHHAKYIQPEILSLRNLPKPEQSDLVMRLGMKPILDKLED